MTCVLKNIVSYVLGNAGLGFTPMTMNGIPFNPSAQTAKTVKQTVTCIELTAKNQGLSTVPVSLVDKKMQFLQRH